MKDLEAAVRGLGVVREHLQEAAFAVRRTRTTGWMIRWTPLPSRLSSMLTESTRKGMSSLTISTTVCVEVQPCSSSCGV